MSKDVHYIVRHGEYERSTGKLSERGKDQSADAALVLLAKGLGSGAMILASAAEHVVESAEIIASRIGIELPIVPSRRIEVMSNHARGIFDLNRTIATALAEKNLSAGAGSSQDLIVVTHAPMVAVAKGVAIKDSAKLIGHGEIVEYDALSHEPNPEYVEAFESASEEDIKRPSAGI